MIITFSRFTAWPSDKSSWAPCFGFSNFSPVGGKKGCSHLGYGPLRYILWSFAERNSKTMLFKPTNNEKFVCAPFWPQALEMLTLRGYLADRLNIIIKLFSINRTGGQFELKMMKYDTKIVFLLLNSVGYKNYRIHTRKS